MEIEVIETRHVKDDRTYDKRDYLRDHHRPLLSHRTLEAFAPLGLSGRRRIEIVWAQFDRPSPNYRDVVSEPVTKSRGHRWFHVDMRPEMSLVDLRDVICEVEAESVYDLRVRLDGVIEAWLPA